MKYKAEHYLHASRKFATFRLIVTYEEKLADFITQFLSCLQFKRFTLLIYILNNCLSPSTEYEIASCSTVLFLRFVSWYNSISATRGRSTTSIFVERLTYRFEISRSTAYWDTEDLYIEIFDAHRRHFLCTVNMHTLCDRCHR